MQVPEKYTITALTGRGSMDGRPWEITPRMEVVDWLYENESRARYCIRPSGVYVVFPDDASLVQFKLCFPND